MIVVATRVGSYEERTCLRCFERRVYDVQRGAWVGEKVIRGQGRTAYNRISRELPTREEHMSENLHQKIIDIICEEWPTPDGYLLGSYIYERLRRQGVNVTDHVLNDELAGLASRGRITLTLVPHGDTPGQVRAGGGAAIHDVEDDLCP